MDDTATTTTPATPAKTLAEQVRQVLHDSAAPLALPKIKSAVKALGEKLPGKPAEQDAALHQLLSALVADGKVYQHGSGKTAKFSTTPPLADQVLNLLGPTDKRKPADVLAAVGQSSKAAQAAVNKALKQLAADGKVFAHGTGKNLEYATFPPPPPPPPLTEQILKLLGPTDAMTTADMMPTLEGAPTAKAANAAVKNLVAEGKLFPHPGGKYGRHEPPKPKWYDTAPHKSKFTSLVNAAKKLLDVGDVTAEQVVVALREKLASVVKPDPKPPVPPPVSPVAPPPPPAPTADLRAVLKQAYDHLCQFVEFRDRLVELPRLYHESVKRMPALTHAAFQHELWQMSEERRIELHVLNEVHSAKEPHLAIHRNDRLYYYARWK